MSTHALKVKNSKFFLNPLALFALRKPSLTITILNYILQLLNFCTPNLINRQLTNKTFNPFNLSGVKLPEALVRKPLKWLKSNPNSNRSELAVSFSKHSTKHLYKLFILFLRLSFKNSSFFFKAHYANRLIFNLNTRDDLLSLNTTTLFAR